MLYISSAAIAAGLMIGVHGQSSSLSVSTSACSTILTPTNSIQPTVASGYRMALVATGLTAPRSIEFDSEGNLLVVQQGAGIVNLELQDAGGTCVTVKSKRNVVTNSTVSLSS